MNILLLTDWTFPCDHQFLKTVYAENLLDKGHNITWVMRPEQGELDSISQHKWNGSNVYVLPSSAFNPVQNTIKHATGNIQSNRIFDTNIEFSKFDLIHVRNDLSMGLIAAYLSNKYKLPYVHQISHLKAEALIEAAQQGFDTRLSWFKGHLGKRLRHYVSSSSDLILPISEEMRNYLKQNSYTTPMRILPTGAEVPKEIPSSKMFKSSYGIGDKNMLLYMGSMSPYRNLEFLFDVLNSVRDNYDVELIMAGGRSESARIRLEKKAIEKGVRENITFTGWISDRQLIKSTISAADIGLSPFPTDSILRTNAPIKTLEYMSIGTPVVASATPDQQVVLNESGGGYAVEYRVNAFVEAITDILSGKELMNEMGNNGRVYLKDNRNFDCLTEKVEGIYEDTI